MEICKLVFIVNTDIIISIVNTKYSSEMPTVPKHLASNFVFFIDSDLFILLPLLVMMASAS